MLFPLTSDERRKWAALVSQEREWNFFQNDEPPLIMGFPNPDWFYFNKFTNFLLKIHKFSIVSCRLFYKSNAVKNGICEN